MDMQNGGGMIPAADNIQATKKFFKSKLSWLMGGLLLYLVIMNCVVFVYMMIYMIVQGVIAGISGEPYNGEEIINKLMETDMGMGLSVIVGCIFMWLFNRKQLTIREIFVKRKPMNVSTFFMILCVLMGVQLIFTIFNNVVEFLLNQIGLTAEAAIESAQAGSTTISMMLYVGFIGPFAEELIYRGYTMQGLERMANTITGGRMSNKGYAMLVSALLFGVMHANPTQSVFAFLVGFVFAYTAMEYSIWWSILYHILNNFLFGDVMLFVLNKLPEKVGDIISLAVLVAFFVAGVIVLIVKRKTVAAYIKENYRGHGKFYSWTFTNILFWVFVAVNGIMAIISIQKLE